ncbi:MAG TPA: class I SAM-dependent methyltransferase [Stellaceae bacterium]|nr:class I SAM-dependent methyltransferase [Stellaceae bacterium]
MYEGNDQHYYAVGRSASINITQALLARLNYGGDAAPVERVLDFGSGYGRVARYLRAMFPAAAIDVTELDARAVEWCIREFGCEDMGADLPAGAYDLIWAGSVFTHLPEDSAIELLSKMKAGLKPNGLMVLTTIGRYALSNLETFALQHKLENEFLSYNLTPAAAAKICSEYRATGFGYCDYPHQQGYGIALIGFDWFIRKFVDDEIVQVMAQERAWDIHQDVVAFMRRPLSR